MGMREIVLADADDLAGSRDRGFESDFGRIQALIRVRSRQRLLRQGERRLAAFEESQNVVRQARVQAIQIIYSSRPS